MNKEPIFKLFKIKDVFETKKFKRYASIPELEDEQEDFNLIDFVSSSDENNGVSAKVNKKFISFKKDDKYAYCITLSTNGKCFSPFLHNEDISCSNDVEILVHPKLNLYNGLYLVSVLKFFQNYGLFSYGYKPKNNKVYDVVISLPVKDDFIDWEFMSDFMKDIVDTQLNKFIKIRNNKKD